MFECVAVWDGELFAHTAATADEAKEWAKCYTQQKIAPFVSGVSKSDV